MLKSLFPFRLFFRPRCTTLLSYAGSTYYTPMNIYTKIRVLFSSCSCFVAIKRTFSFSRPKRQTCTAAGPQNSFVSTLSSCSSDASQHNSNFLANVMKNIYSIPYEEISLCQWELPDNATNLSGETTSSVLQRNPAAKPYNILLKQCVIAKNYEEITAIVRTMQQNKVQLDETSYLLLISAYNTLPNTFERVQRLFNQMLKSGIKPTRKILNAYLHASIRTEDDSNIVAAWELFNKFHIEPMTDTYAILITHLSEHGRVKDALEKWEEAKKTKNTSRQLAMYSSFSRCFSSAALGRRTYLSLDGDQSSHGPL